MGAPLETSPENAFKEVVTSILSPFARHFSTQIIYHTDTQNFKKVTDRELQQQFISSVMQSMDYHFIINKTNKLLPEESEDNYTAKLFEKATSLFRNTTHAEHTQENEKSLEEDKEYLQKRIDIHKTRQTFGEFIEKSSARIVCFTEDKGTTEIIKYIDHQEIEESITQMMNDVKYIIYRDYHLHAKPLYEHFLKNISKTAAKLIARDKRFCTKHLEKLKPQEPQEDKNNHTETAPQDAATPPTEKSKNTELSRPAFAPTEISPTDE